MMNTASEIIGSCGDIRIENEGIWKAWECGNEYLKLVSLCSQGLLTENTAAPGWETKKREGQWWWC